MGSKEIENIQERLKRLEERFEDLVDYLSYNLRIKLPETIN